MCTLGHQFTCYVLWLSSLFLTFIPSRLKRYQGFLLSRFRVAFLLTLELQSDKGWCDLIGCNLAYTWWIHSHVLRYIDVIHVYKNDAGRPCRIPSIAGLSWEISWSTAWCIRCVIPIALLHALIKLIIMMIAISACARKSTHCLHGPLYVHFGMIRHYLLPKRLHQSRDSEWLTKFSSLI